MRREVRRKVLGRLAAVVLEDLDTEGFWEEFENLPEVEQAEVHNFVVDESNRLLARVGQRWERDQKVT